MLRSVLMITPLTILFGANLAIQVVRNHRIDNKEKLYCIETHCASSECIAGYPNHCIAEFFKQIEKIERKK